MKKFISLAILFLSFLPANAFHERSMEIKAAIYFSNIEKFAQEIKIAIDYSWEAGDIKYSIKPEIVDKQDVMRGKLANYDVFIIPGSGRPYFDALLPKWRENVRDFVANGGGYIGICGGANLASMGFGERGINSVLGRGALKIANIYVNNEQDEEWQYLWKSNWEQGGIPIKLYVAKSEVPIFSGFYNSYINMRYWGGPGMYEGNESDDELMSKVIPLAFYAEEPSSVAPLHFWQWKNGQWIPKSNITTDIKGEYAVVACNYGEGRVILFGPHPERETFLDGYVREFPVRPYMGRFTWFIYEWIGNKSVISYNWWILRRSVAWAAGLSEEEMPYASRIAACIEKPDKGIYFNGRKLMDSKQHIYIGRIEFEGYGIECRELSLYIDGELFERSKDRIYATLMLGAGWHRLRLKASSEREEAADEVNILSL